jgi:hypothetical protein
MPSANSVGHISWPSPQCWVKNFARQSRVSATAPGDTVLPSRSRTTQARRARSPARAAHLHRHRPRSLREAEVGEGRPESVASGLPGPRSRERSVSPCASASKCCCICSLFTFLRNCSNNLRPSGPTRFSSRSMISSGVRDRSNSPAPRAARHSRAVIQISYYSGHGEGWSDGQMRICLRRHENTVSFVLQGLFRPRRRGAHDAAQDRVHVRPASEFEPT